MLPLIAPIKSKPLSNETFFHCLLLSSFLPLSFTQAHAAINSMYLMNQFVSLQPNCD